MFNCFLDEPTDATFREMNDKFTEVEEYRFFYSMQQKKRSIEDINIFISRLKISFDYTAKEYERVNKLKDTYNIVYYSDHNTYLSLVIMLMKKIRSTLSSYKNIIKEFKNKKKRGSRIDVHSRIDSQTTLFGGAYSQDLFGWESYPDNRVKELYDMLNKYLELASKCVRLCDSMVKDEELIKANPEIAEAIYLFSYNESIDSNKKLIDALESRHMIINNKYVKMFDETENVKQLIADLFHVMSKPEFNEFCAYKRISDGRKAGLSDEEANLFGANNKEKVVRLNVLLEHILEFISQYQKATKWTGKLSGEFMVMLLKWCGWDGSKDEGLLNYIVKKCQDKIKVVKMGAIQAAKRKNAKTDLQTVKKAQSIFNESVDSFIDSILRPKAAISN